MYGEGEHKDRLIPYIRRQLSAGEVANLTSGKQIRDYLDVNVAGRQIVDAAIGYFNGPLNICSGIPITVAELACKIADEYGRRDLLAFGVKSDTNTDPVCVFGEPSFTRSCNIVRSVE